MRTLKKIAVAVIVAPALFVALFISYAWIREWRPAEVENVNFSQTPAQIITGDTLRLLSWNIGYGGLGDNMDFFMDGGLKARDTEQRTRKNIDAIKRLLTEYSHFDFILLQEVDSISKRNYGMNLYGEIVDLLPMFNPYYAVNYQSIYVPIPLKDPIGKVKSGLLTLSRHSAATAQRVSLPQNKSFPTRLFHLKRALLVAGFDLGDDQKLYVANCHNSAFDDGGDRQQEMAFIRQTLDTMDNFIITGDWNSTPPKHVQSSAESENEFFHPIKIHEDDLGQSVNFAVDYSGRSARYNYEPYQKGRTTTTLIDFAVSSRNITPIETKVLDLGFENSDHNPVIYTFVVNN